MAYDFGNIYGMTKQEFETAIAYYQNKISQMEGDYSINPGAKRWFLKRYNERVRKLVESYKDLQEVINTAKESGYVNESTATLNSLNGTASVDNSQFANMEQTPRKHRWGQFFRILGAILLPVVGTIPLTISAVRSRRRFRAVKNALRQENIDMNNFVNETNRSHDAGLGTSPSFTEEEMKNLLSHPAEIDRLEALTNPADPTLSPAEKAVLVKKLTTLKAFGQNNGYKFVTTTPANNSEIKALTDTKFNTSVDKISAGLAAIVAPTNLETARNTVLELKALKTQAESLRIEGGDNRLIDGLIAKIDAEISTNMGRAQTYIDNGYTSMNGSLLAAAAPNMSITDEKARYNDSNARLDSAYAATVTEFGTDVATARSYADELGLATDKFENLKNTYDSSKANNNNKLAEISARENFENELNIVDNLFSDATSGIDKLISDMQSLTPPAVPDPADIISLKASLDRVKNSLDSTEAYYNSLPNTDPLKSRYSSLSLKYTTQESAYKRIMLNVKVSESGFNAYSEIIENNQYDPADDLDTLNNKKAAIIAARDIIAGDTTLKDEMEHAKPSRLPEYMDAINHANAYIAVLETHINAKTIDKIKSDRKFGDYETMVNNNKFNASADISTLLANLANLEYVITNITDPTYQAGIEADVNTLVANATAEINNIKSSTTYTNHLTDCKTISGLNDFIQNAEKALESYEKKKVVDRKIIDNTRGIIVEAQHLYTIADTVDPTHVLKHKLEAIVNRGNTFLTGKSYDAIEHVESHF